MEQQITILPEIESSLVVHLAPGSKDFLEYFIKHNQWHSVDDLARVFFGIKSKTNCKKIRAKLSQGFRDWLVTDEEAKEARTKGKKIKGYGAGYFLLRKFSRSGRTIEAKLFDRNSHEDKLFAKDQLEAFRERKSESIFLLHKAAHVANLLLPLE